MVSHIRDAFKLSIIGGVTDGVQSTLASYLGIASEGL